MSEYPKCTFCGRPIMFIGKRPYDAVIPEHLQGTIEGSMWKFSGPHLHRCEEYREAKEAEERDAPLWSHLLADSKRRSP